VIKYIKKTISNEKFKQDFIGDHTAWCSSFVEYPGSAEGKKWAGSAVNCNFPPELENPDANNFISVSSFDDPTKRRKLADDFAS
jgi:hypothetical protein